MIFSFSSYLLNNLMLPVFAIAFVAFPVFKMIGRIIGQLVRGESLDFGDPQAGIMFIALILLMGVLVNILISGGGLGLITERVDDAVSVEGTIEQIHSGSIWSNPRYSTNGEVSNGYHFVIDGVECFGMAKGGLDIGDTVTATYMPKTGYILTINEIG